MFELINARMSIPARLAVLCLLFCAPVVLGVFLFTQQSWKDIAFAGKELDGTAYLQTLWPKVAAGAADVGGQDAGGCGVGGAGGLRRIARR